MPQELDLGVGFPRIHVCQNAEEMEKISGIKLCHGFFDPKKFEIYATADSIAHEVGHVKDISSGLFRSASTDLDSSQRATWLMRNEAVAIFFAFSKVGIGGANLPHEAHLINWIEFQTKKKSFEKLCDLKNASFDEIQKFASWLTEPAHSWRKHLEFIFRAYLINEQETLWYNRRSELYKRSSV